MTNEEKNSDISIEDLLAHIDNVRSKRYSYTHTLPITITCLNCKTKTRGTIDAAKKWYDKDKQFYYPTFYCPNCPPIVDYKDWMQKVLGIKFTEVQIG